MALWLPPLEALLVLVFAQALVDTPLAAAVGRCVPAAVADDDLVAANALRSDLQRATPPHLLGRVLANVYDGVGVAAAVG